LDEENGDFGTIEELESDILAAIYGALNIELPSASVENEILKADLRMLATEKRDLMYPESPAWDTLKDIEPYKETIRPDAPVVAEMRFRNRMNSLRCLNADN